MATVTGDSVKQITVPILENKRISVFWANSIKIASQTNLVFREHNGLKNLNNTGHIFEALKKNSKQ